MNKNIHMTANGKYAWQVLESGKVVRQSEFLNNYIFDEGLDYVGDIPWAYCFRYCHVGDQTNPTESASLGSPNLESHVHVSSTYYGGDIDSPFDISGCGTEDLGSGLRMRRTFDFSGESSERNYTEIGWSPYESEGASLFSRIITKTGGVHQPVTVYDGQALRIIYELEVYVSNASESHDPILGWSSYGASKVQLYGLSSIALNGSSTWWDEASGSNEPSRRASFFLSDDSTILSSVGHCTDRSVGGPYDYGSTNSFSAYMSNSAYTNGTKTLTKAYIVGGNQGVHDGYYCFGFGGGFQHDGDRPSLDGARYNSFCHLCNSPVEKAYDYVLSVTFTFTWDRQ